MKQPTFAIAVTFEIQPEHVESFRRRILQQAKDSLSKEPECLQFDVLVDEKVENIFCLYETYVDASAFDAHKKTEHFADYDKTVAPWVLTKQVRRLKLISE